MNVYDIFSTPEQKARDMLERMGIEDAQHFSCGDVVELANMIARCEEAGPGGLSLLGKRIAKIASVSGLLLLGAFVTSISMYDPGIIALTFVIVFVTGTLISML